MKSRVVTYYLEMESREQLRPFARPEGAELEIRQARIPCPELSRFLYTAVGGAWYWTDRLPWSAAHWLRHLDRPELETWLGAAEGTPAGYFELERQPEETVEILYFGLIPRFIGRGYGGRLLTAAVERAWAMGARRVRVHTCTLDGPAALANYLARGFRIVREECEEMELPERPPGPWPGAGVEEDG